MWQSWKYATGAPGDVATSCITQPPLAAIAVERVAPALPEHATARAFLAELFPKLVAYHRWCYDERDLDGTGLVTLIHPWECGLDSTPPWMDVLHHCALPWWLRRPSACTWRASCGRCATTPSYLPAAERASDDDGLRMLAAAVHAKRYGFELRRIPPRDRSVLVEDVAFNAMLAAANQALTRIAAELGEDLPAALTTAIARTPVSDRGPVARAVGAVLLAPGVDGCAAPAVDGRRPSCRCGQLPRHRARHAADRAAATPRRVLAAYPVPSVPVGAPDYQEARYWKGPTWVNTNWMIVEGLRDTGAPELADELRRRTLAMVADAGFSEYFSRAHG